MEMFLLYVWTILDRLNVIVGTMVFLSLVLGVLYWVSVYNVYKEDEKKECRKFAKVCVYAFVIFLLCHIFLPTKKDALVLGAGYAIVNIAKSDKATSLGTKAMEYIEQELTNAIKPAKKEAQ